MKLSKFDLGWLVGILEADGTFTADKKSLRIAVKMTDMDTVSRVATLLGTNILGPYNANVKGENYRKDVYVAFVSGKKARSWMMRLRPHMSLRRQKQIEVLLGGQAELFEFPRAL